jgi:ATP-dependent DNA helicase DinG
MIDLAEFFADDGLLAQAVDNYRLRPGQLRMAEAVSDALQDREHLVVEAGTGIGKTYAYLVPVLLTGRKAIISTGTRTLQDQLFLRDLPLLSNAIGRPVKVSLLKGRSNYLCWYRLRQAQDQVGLGRTRGVELEHIARWGEESKRGDLAELTELDEASPLRGMVTSTQDNCLGAQCPQFSKCHLFEARRQAQESDVVVVNHHLLLADMALRQEGFGELLPQAEAVIVDEAHQLPELAQMFFSTSCSSRQLEVLAADVLAEADSIVESDLHGLATELQQAIADSVVGARGTGRRIPWADMPPDLRGGLNVVEEVLGNLVEGLHVVEGRGAGVARCFERASQLAEVLEQLLSREHEDFLKWLDVGQRRFTLHQTPLQVGTTLGSRIEAQRGTWIFTSATLAVGESFDLFLDGIGVEDPSRHVLPSPFDYQKNARLMLLADLPDPGSQHYTAELMNQVWPLIEACGGGAFVLFTSHRALNAASDWLHDHQSSSELPLYIQGQAARSEHLRRFRAAGNGVLLGTGSFWEGVDVRGAALRMVVIDKLPFAPPNDPLVSARMQYLQSQGRNPFGEFQLPTAVLSLKQGVGRLIRDFSDQGLVVLGDPRLTKKNYGRSFVKALPDMARISNPEQALEYVQGLARFAGRQRDVA